MKKTVLSAMTAIALIGLVSPASAIYNLYKKDGLSFDVNGEVNIYAEKINANLTGQLSPNLTGIKQQLTDEKVRLYPDMGASWIDFRASQALDDDWRVTGTLGLGYVQGNTGAHLNSASVSLDKMNVGAVTLGRQYLHTGFVTRTGTYTPLDTFGEQTVRLDYYGLPNLHTSAYYLLPSSTDVRRVADGVEVGGYGASASYKLSIEDDQSVRFAAGYSHNQANPQTTDGIPTKSNNYAVSAEYRLGDAMVAADYGRRQAKLNGRFVAGSDTEYLGVKVGYELTPRLNLMAGYGTRNSGRSYATGVTGAAISTTLAAGLNNPQAGGLPAQMFAPFLFDELKERQLYVRGDYYLRENMRVYAQLTNQEIQARQQNQDYAKLNDNSYRLGVSFVF